MQNKLSIMDSKVLIRVTKHYIFQIFDNSDTAKNHININIINVNSIHFIYGDHGFRNGI